MNRHWREEIACDITIDCIDYITGIGNAHSIYWQSVFGLRASTVIPSTDAFLELRLNLFMSFS